MDEPKDIPELQIGQVESVVVDSLVVMKILKHSRENPHESVQGPLLGLIVNNTLDVTNCFPHLRFEDDDVASAEEEGRQYQTDMMKWLREVNVDHMGVGWYQVTELESFFEQEVALVHFEHQSVIEESIFLIYDPIQTQQGNLAIKAFRLTEAAMKAFKNGSYTPENIKSCGLTYRTIFEEVPVVLRASPLTKALVASLNAEASKSDDFEYLDLASNSYLEREIQRLMSCVDDLSSETVKYQSYMRQVSRQQATLNDLQQKRKLENIDRQAKGLPALPEDDVGSHLKPVTPPSRLDALLTNAQINNYCQQVSQVTSQNLAKLYLAKAVQADE